VFIAPAAFFLTAHYFFIPKEEQLLEALFGEVYTAYQRHVRRWL
jgi:protein-S-isoprenylcysteine O-methyltransferase Ste14